jgi:hypothetical protein
MVCVFGPAHQTTPCRFLYLVRYGYDAAWAEHGRLINQCLNVSGKQHRAMSPKHLLPTAEHRLFAEDIADIIYSNDDDDDDDDETLYSINEEAEVNLVTRDAIFDLQKLIRLNYFCITLVDIAPFENKSLALRYENQYVLWDNVYCYDASFMKECSDARVTWIDRFKMQSILNTPFRQAINQVAHIDESLQYQRVDTSTGYFYTVVAYDPFFEGAWTAPVAPEGQVVTDPSRGQDGFTPDQLASVAISNHVYICNSKNEYCGWLRL